MAAPTLDQIQALAADLESDRIERTVTTSNAEKFREAICAFANDLPGHRAAGYVLIGVTDAGAVEGVVATDAMLLDLAGLRDDGQIQPQPSLEVHRLPLPNGRAVIVIAVEPSESPPVRTRGRTYIRVGPRRAIATPEEERRLSERRLAHARTFDQRPCSGASLDDLLVDVFRGDYLPQAIAPEVLAQNRRSIEDQLASLRFYDLRTKAPTHAGLLLFGLDPRAAIPGAFAQITRFDGTALDAPVQDHKRLTGNLLTQLRELDAVLPIQIRTARVPAGGLRFEDVPDYPLAALRELVLNAFMHRSYEGTSAPVRVSWFTDRVEIQNPGGLYGQVTAENFGRVADYRNPVLAEAMSALGYVDKYGVGVARARKALADNGNPPPEFVFEPTHVLVVVRGRHREQAS